jgi:uncharacterized membrane protein
LLAVIEFLFSGVCHQIPERCLVYGGRALPLCARCTGTFLGIVIALGILALLGEGRRTGLPSTPMSAVLIALIGVWAVDGSNSLLYLVTGIALLYEPSNVLRLVTGMGCGLALGAVLYPILQFALWGVGDDRRTLRPAWHLGVLLSAGAGGVAVTLGWVSAPWLFWVVVVTGAVCGALGMVNALLIVLLLHKEGCARTKGGALYALLGLAAAFTEMAVLGFIRHLLTNPNLASLRP